MADSDAKQPTHRVYSVIRREGQDDYWLNIGLVFPHKDGAGFNLIPHSPDETTILSALATVLG